jgi:hypothetical protein
MKKQITKPIISGLTGIVPEGKTYLKAKDISRIMSKLITGFCRGTIKSSDAKDLSYLCTQFIHIKSAVDFESRIRKLEGLLNGKTN